jgi:hypothetical protein
MYKVLGLRKTNSAEPEREYELILKDSKNQRPGYVRSTEYGAEAGIRNILKVHGLTDAQIDTYFLQANTSSQLQAAALPVAMGRATKRTPSAAQTRLTVSNRGALSERSAR